MDNKKQAELLDKAIPITAITGMCVGIFFMFGIIISRSPALILIGMSTLAVIVLALTGMIVFRIAKE